MGCCASGRSRLASLRAALIVALGLALAPAATRADAAPMNLPACAADPAALSALVDPLLSQQLERRKIAGAVVIIVSGDAVLLAKGYGFADVANRRPMSSDQTLVRPGSISKLFTALAVMQLVAEGKLDLDRDVNAYLDFRVPTPAGGVPVTLRRLMTHRAGFEEHLKDLFARGGAPAPLGPWLAGALPRRIFPAGDVPAYSNYGMALAGYIVERVSGERFADYIAAHILRPLAMTRSTFQQPLPGALAPLMSQGYDSTAKPAHPFFETILMAPAGGLSATGADMARFMRALLAGGNLDGAEVLPPTSVAQMMSPQVEGLAGRMGLVFYEQSVDGVPLIGHDGATLGFLSKLMLWPSARFGLFVSYNSAAAGGRVFAGDVLLRRVVQRCFPGRSVESAPYAPRAMDAAQVAGTYEMSRRGETSLVKLGALLEQRTVRALPDGSIRLRNPLALGPDRGNPLREIAPLRYRTASGMILGFAEGGGTMRFEAGPPLSQYQRLPWYGDARVVLGAVTASVALIVITLLAWPAAALWRRRRRVVFGRKPWEKRAHRLVRAVLLLDLGVFGAVVLLRDWSEDMTNLNATLDPWLVGLYVLAWLAVLGAFAVAGIALAFWLHRVGGPWTRLHHTLIAAAAAVLALFCAAWHIAGTTLVY
jgi:CubicO group peptidase (beta-lactamase class C family)